ncbi:MAG: molybdopterin molybdotransferase MoeA [Alphaproteobacteria bacterium]|nr:molybdopterin molybdotransferase MoeA [Alphaproteobacteria bacterium]
MISVAEALQRVLTGAKPLGAEQVGLAEALGRTLAEDVRARRTQPPAAMSAMDGYAVRGADVGRLPATLTQVGSVPAGKNYPHALKAGECVRIFTGAPLPEGADTIVIQEDTEVSGDRITMTNALSGKHVRKAGIDFREGDVVLRAGRVLTPRDIGLAAAANWPWLSVARRPRVAILPTGDEVVMPGDPIGPNQIVSSNGPALAAFVRACGGEPLLMGVAPDEANALQAMVAAARGVDLLVTTGGASVGEHDLVRDALAAEGMTLDFWKIAMRPGKPLIFGRLGAVPVLGLPGNPVSTIVCAALFLRPLLDALLGAVRPAAEANPTAKLAQPLTANDQRQDYIRATLSRDATGALTVAPFPLQDSSMVSVLARADALIVRKPSEPAAKAGDLVEILPLGNGALGI